MKVALSLSAIALLIGVSACSTSPDTTSNPTTTNRAQTSQLARSDSALAQSQSSPLEGPQRPVLDGKAIAVIQVNGKAITVELDGTHAPVTVGNFVDLAQRGVYDGTRFHRVIKAPTPFVAQGGDPQGKDPSVPDTRLGSGNFLDPQTNRDRYIPLEIKPSGEPEPLYSQTFKGAGITKSPQLPHRKGAIAMARTSLPDTASAQFYFALADLDFLDGEYAVFGYVTDGMDVVEAIEQGDVIESVKITQGAEALKQGADQNKDADQAKP